MPVKVVLSMVKQGTTFSFMGLQIATVTVIKLFGEQGWWGLGEDQETVTNTTVKAYKSNY